MFDEYRNTAFFRERTGYYFTWLRSWTDDLASQTGFSGSVARLLADEGENLKYCVVAEDGQAVATNMEGDPSSAIGRDNMPVLPDGYEYCWYFDGRKVWVIDRGQPVDTDRLDSGYRGLLPVPDAGDRGEDEGGAVRILMAVRNVLVENPYGHSRYYQEQQFLLLAGRGLIALLALGATLLAFGVARLREKRDFDRRLAKWSGRMWFEVKGLLSVLALLCLSLAGALIHDSFGGRAAFAVSGAGLAVAITALCWFYVMLADLASNRGRFFSHNTLNSLLAWYRRYESRYAWQKRMLKRAYALIAAEVALALLSVWALLLAIDEPWFLPVALAIAGAGLYVIFRYLRRYGSTVADFGRLMDHIHRIKRGDMETKLEVAADADIFPAAQDLNSIQEGMGLAVSDKMKSERMKIDLITNVSHDLKTPLTSMISYVELLEKEEGLPEHVKEYIRILSRKTGRLKDLIQDLFDLSKATSHDIALDIKRIDLARLVNQALADLEEPISLSGLAFRVNLPHEPVHIVSDGNKMYRVFQNLISNAIKYSLIGSRVFIELVTAGREAAVTIKNTANYEMDFADDEILQRFARGDRSRSTEGSGLGLSIAKSFTEACGGRFGITIDGDQFKVELRFEMV